MNGFSAEHAAILAQVRPLQIFCLLEILQSASVRQRAFVSARFEERATHFQETVQLLEDLRWVQADGELIVPTHEAVARIVAASETERGLVLADALVEDAGPYESLFAHYLGQFERRDLDFVYQPTGERRLQESPVRDFLMELGAVAHQPLGDFYVLTEPFSYLRLWARNVQGPADQAELDRRAQARHELGRAAELAALDWEKRRLGSTWSSRVRHISDRSPASCYDIQSVTLAGTASQPRFIEVKAVATETYQFHWTAAEIEAAQMLGTRYFLYLLPVRGSGTFDLEKMKVIQNPFADVYQSPAEWSKMEAVVVCQKREIIPS